ncbi:hypothetical protein HZS_6220 [Henneguya salminicola]|nr:hypothetical protein HZS_6220 [Henneguya salminicola]
MSSNFMYNGFSCRKNTKSGNKELIVSLRSKFKDIPFALLAKKTVHKKTRENRRVMNLNSIQAAITNIQRFINGKFFLRRQSFLEIHGEYNQIMLWATNESLSLLRYNTHTFIDGTFRSTPAPFTQCIIVMCFLNITGFQN